MIPTLFTASCLWRGPNDSEQVIYFCGTSKQTFNNVSLVDSEDSEYTAQTAFKLVGTEPDDLNRIYKLKASDKITLNVSREISYGIDSYKGYIIFSSAISTANVRATIERHYASVHTSNLVSFEKIIDFRTLDERAITSMVPSNDGIYLSGISGKIWFYNGEYIRGPIFTLQDETEEISASCMLIHKFDHETEDYLYVGSDEKPRLFRAKLSTAYSGSQWEQVYPLGVLAATTGGILSLASAYNKIFIGCRNGKIHRYTREQEILLSQPTNLLTEEVVEEFIETESLNTSTLISNNISDYEAKEFGIKSLSVGKNQVFAGIDRKPEIWAYSELLLNNPENDESWSKILFDEVFLGDPAPAQFYSYDNETLSRSNENLAVARFENQNSPSGYNEFLVIKGNTTTALGATSYGARLFEISDGSDFEQLIYANLPDQDFINVKCASFEAITSWNNFLDLDGYTFELNDIFMLKDQTSLGTNQIYNGIYKFLGPDVDPVPVIISNYITNDSVVLGFYIENGYINGGNRYLLNYNTLVDTNTYTFYKPKYTIESEFINLSNSQLSDDLTLRDSDQLNNSEQVQTNFQNGHQGFEVSDLYGNYSILINNDEIRVESGSSLVTKPIISTGIVENWQFYEVASGIASTSLSNWSSRQFVDSLIPEIYTISDLLNNDFNKFTLSITPSSTGNPSIEISGLDSVVDLDSVIKIKFRAQPKSQSLSSSKVRAYWAYSDGIFVNYADTEIHSSENFVEYTIKPIWNGVINKLAIEFIDLPENFQRPDKINIDYIQILSDENVFDANNKLSRIRWVVEDRDIKIYLGHQRYPFIYKKNFIKLDTFNKKYIDSTSTIADYDKPFIKFGKLDNNSGDSLFGYSYVSFIIGESYPPVKTKTIDFNLISKLPSTGGVRLFTYHDGTLYCSTDGYQSSKFADNPDDRQSKLFYYKSDSESWFREEITFDRKKIFDNTGAYDLLGVVRPLTAISYKGRLFLSGHYGSIKVT
jgi:hypothetical protein